MASKNHTITSQKKQPKLPKTNGKLVKNTTSKQHIKKKLNKTISTKKITKTTSIVFQINYHTTFGQELFITGNHEIFGNNNLSKALAMHYLNNDWWSVSLDLTNISLTSPIIYNYVLRNADGSIIQDWGNDKVLDITAFKTKEVLIKDTWNYAGYYQNSFYTEPFKKVLLNQITNTNITSSKKTTHLFKIKVPILQEDELVCITGSTKALKNWNSEQPLLMYKKNDDDFFYIGVDLSKTTFPVAYKYAIYNTKEHRITKYEDGDNRLLYDEASINKTVIINNGFIALPATQWKGAGVAIPVFSLRSEKNFGVGEFTDIKLLVDWNKKVGLKLIQLLPINDTTATNTWVDSYPYAAISAFALHPLYLNLQQVAGKKYQTLFNKLETERKRLNALPSVDYEAVMKIKTTFIQQIFPLVSKTTFASKSYQAFYQSNKQWLIPYAAFSFLRDTNKTANFNEWKTHQTFNEKEIETLVEEKGDAIKIHFFIQYQLHLQLKQATEYAHKNGVIIKGDIPIGICPNSADAWQQPDLYNMDMQAGAPPDNFAVKGQNWGFPTYNWQKMKEDGYTWWKQRFEQMSYYFDAFRIDHILGFFRIWSIPTNAVEGIMGHFVPAIPVNIEEFSLRNIPFNYNRYTQPYINDDILLQLFDNDADYVKKQFLKYNEFDTYILKPEYNNQKKVETYFATLDTNKKNKKIKEGLFNLISNVILFEEKGSKGKQFHFRFAVHTTSSFKHFDEQTQKQIYNLYINYYFHRQDDFWLKEAMQKLPALKRVTNMLVCGEDLGLVSSCVPIVMKQLGLLSLEIQRMPKDAHKDFFHPNDAPYLSVVTPSTHDMSTIRGWWEENKNTTQHFYNNELGKQGNAPQHCEAWISEMIIMQHLHSPAMWSIFQLQDLMGIDDKLRRENFEDERINVPSNPKNYWKYRMHLPLEKLLKEINFNTQLKQAITISNR
ncbi:MAG: 4-alpha-glucanotransferase [Bacteroidetes bacterium]|nr:4-alpha-glucanotransferase [Bacteroidota bacterium]MBS1650125.1 4-alpha-glucanotransferase [Bacteroidota bacterium]